MCMDCKLLLVFIPCLQETLLPYIEWLHWHLGSQCVIMNWSSVIKLITSNHLDSGLIRKWSAQLWAELSMILLLLHLLQICSHLLLHKEAVGDNRRWKFCSYKATGSFASVQQCLMAKYFEVWSFQAAFYSEVTCEVHGVDLQTAFTLCLHCNSKHCWRGLQKTHTDTAQMAHWHSFYLMSRGQILKSKWKTSCSLFLVCGLCISFIWRGDSRTW